MIHRPFTFSWRIIVKNLASCPVCLSQFHKSLKWKQAHSITYPLPYFIEGMRLFFIDTHPSFDIRVRLLRQLLLPTVINKENKIHRLYVKAMKGKFLF